MDLPAPNHLPNVPARPSQRVLFGLLLVLLPIAAFSSISIVGAQWQSGQLSDYVSLLISPSAAVLFLPLIIFSIGTYLLLLVNSSRYSPNIVIRVGIYGGVVLALQYSILAAFFLPLSLATGFGLVALYLAISRFGWKIPLFLVFMAVVVALFFVPPLDFIRTLPLSTLMCIISAAPVICFSILLMTAVNLFRGYEIPLTVGWVRASWLGAWLAVYAAAWVYSITQMFQLYASLPKQPPDCFIATAAAQGHPAFVGSRPVSAETGTLLVNRQLQTLKCTELALKAVVPAAHRPLRKFYDIWGRLLASRLKYPILADLAYLLLKPFELSCYCAMKLLIPDIEIFLSQIYR